MSDFTVYPAIDLRNGQVVRLREGDPHQQTTYSSDPASVADLFFSAGFDWLHVVNLDGAFGQHDEQNQQVIRDIIQSGAQHGGQIQFGGGLRSLAAIHNALELGISRVVLGTLLIEKPEMLAEALRIYGPEKIVAGMDARQGLVRIHGWVQETPQRAIDLAIELADNGLEWLIFTDVARDGMQRGLNLVETQNVARLSGLNVIASGGVKALEDVMAAHQAGLSGVIVGRALYDGKINLAELADISTSL